MQLRNDPIIVQVDGRGRPVRFAWNRTFHEVTRIQLTWSDNEIRRFRVAVTSERGQGIMQLRRGVHGWVMERAWTP